MADWIIAGAAIMTLFGGGAGLYAKFSGIVSANTQAIKDLNDYMKRQDDKNSCQDAQLQNHEGRIGTLEGMHGIKG